MDLGEFQDWKPFAGLGEKLEMASLSVGDSFTLDCFHFPVDFIFPLLFSFPLLFPPFLGLVFEFEGV